MAICIYFSSNILPLLTCIVCYGTKRYHLHISWQPIESVLNILIYPHPRKIRIYIPMLLSILISEGIHAFRTGGNPINSIFLIFKGTHFRYIVLKYSLVQNKRIIVMIINTPTPGFLIYWTCFDKIFFMYIKYLSQGNYHLKLHKYWCT